MPNISTIVSEYMPVKRKAFLTGLAGCGFMLGISCGGVLSAYLLERYGCKSDYYWRKHSLILVVALLLKLPESTQYLITRHQQDKAQRILENIRYHSFQEPIKLVLTQAENTSDKNPVKVVLGKYLWGSSMLWLCCFTSLLVFYLLTSWMPTILKQQVSVPNSLV